MTQTPYDGPGDDQHTGPHSESQPDPQADTKTAGPRVSAEEARDLGRLRRSRTDRKVAGVAGGLGRHLDIDPTLLRVAFVVLCFFGGAGFVLYGAAWLLVPEDGAEEGTISASPSTRTTMLVIAGVIAALLLVSDGWWGGWGFPWPLAILGLVLFFVLKNKDKSDSTQQPAAQWAAQQPGPDDTWAPPATTYQQAAPKPDRGPKLFWPTIALVAIALGSLNLYDLSSGSVVDSAYPAVALTVVGVMLVVGAWVGRAGGLIFLGIVAAVVLAASSLTSGFDGPTLRENPIRASELEQSYYVPAGSIHLDLTDIEDLEALDNRLTFAEANVGEIVVTVPDDVTAHVFAEVDAGGNISVPGQSEGGNDIDLRHTIDGGPGAPELRLDLQLVFGSIEVRKQ